MKSLNKILDIIDLIAERKRAGIREISQITGFPPPTVHRIVSALLQRRYLQQDPATKTYSLSLRFLELGTMVQNQFNLASIARPLLEQLVAATRESASIIIRDGDDAVYMDHVRDSHMLQLFARLGARVPLYSTGGGKAILSFLPDDEIEDYLKRVPLKRFTPKTIVDQKKFFDALHKIRKKGYAVDDEEMEAGIRCVAAPVFNHLKNPVGAISVTGASVRILLEQIEYYGAVVRNFAETLSRSLGYKTK